MPVLKKFVHIESNTISLELFENNNELIIETKDELRNHYVCIHLDVYDIDFLINELHQIKNQIKNQ